MIMDETLEFCDATSVAASAGTALVGDVIDTNPLRDIGQGYTMYLVITCSTSIITGGTAGTISFQLASDSTSSIATDGSATTHWQSDTFVTDDDGSNDIDAGDIIAVIPLPWGYPSYERYLGILVTTATTTTTAGAINAFLTLDPGVVKLYANNEV